MTGIQGKNYFPSLDGLRGMAILMVMAYHYFPGSILSNFGWSGVDLFFVLSGFLITGRLIPYSKNITLLMKFYRNRILRIVPLYVSFLIIFFLLWFLFTSRATQAAFPFYSGHWYSFFLFIQNWIFIISQSVTKVHLQHLWSIAVEEQIYLLFPLLVLFLKSNKKILISCICLLFISICSRCIYSFYLPAGGGYDKVYWNTFFRIDPFLTGVLIYFVFHSSLPRKTISQFINIAAFICAAIVFCHMIITGDSEKNNLFMSSIGFTLVAVVYGAFTWSQLHSNKNLLGRLTSLSCLRFTGKISFGIYIIHWPLYVFGFTFLNKLCTYFGIDIAGSHLQLINALLCIVISFCLATFSFAYFESRFLRMKAKPS